MSEISSFPSLFPARLCKQPITADPLASSFSLHGTVPRGPHKKYAANVEVNFAVLCCAPSQIGCMLGKK